VEGKVQHLCGGSEKGDHVTTKGGDRFFQKELREKPRQRRSGRGKKGKGCDYWAKRGKD